MIPRFPDAPAPGPNPDLAARRFAEVVEVAEPPSSPASIKPVAHENEVPWGYFIECVRGLGRVVVLAAGIALGMIIHTEYLAHKIAANVEEARGKAKAQEEKAKAEENRFRQTP